MTAWLHVSTLTESPPGPHDTDTYKESTMHCGIPNTHNICGEWMSGDEWMSWTRVLHEYARRLSTTPLEVNHPGLGTHPAFTRQATSCRFLPRYKTETHSVNYNIVLNIDIKRNSRQTRMTNPGIYYVTRKTRFHFTIQPLAVTRPAFCNARSKTTLTPPIGVTCTHHSFHIFPGST